MITNQEFILDFVQEAKQHLSQLELELVGISKNEDKPTSIHTIFRIVHSIKGTGSFFGLTSLVKLAHALENVFGEIRNDNQLLSESILDPALEAQAALDSMVSDILNSNDHDISHLVDRLETCLTSSAVSERNSESANGVECAVCATNEMPLPISHLDKIADALQHGQKPYWVNLVSNNDILEPIHSYMDIFQKMQAIGCVEEVFLNNVLLDDWNQLVKYPFDSTGKVQFLLTSVLSIQLLESAIGVDATAICQLSTEMLKKSNSAYGHQEESNTIENSAATPPIEREMEATETKGLTNTQEAAPAKKILPLEDSIRVHVSVLDSLLDMASEMVLGRNQLLRTLDGIKKDVPGLTQLLQNIDRLTSGMQEKIMQTRMQPVSNIFNRFPRLIRELSKKLGKEMELVLEGTDVELDKSVLEALSDPLTHLVRNCADHGIETSQDRIQKGKNPSGRIVLRAYHDGGTVSIDVIDDGAGINTKKILEKAQEKGLITRTAADAMSEQDIFHLLFKPGFSTADAVTDLSGRGVGMDVVKTNLERIGGTIDVFSAPGEGTRFRLSIPLTLAIIQSLIVEVLGQRFVLPQSNIREIVRLNSDHTKTGQWTQNKVETLHGQDVLRLRGKLLPVLHLKDALMLQPAEYMSSSQHVQKIIVLTVSGCQYGLAVNHILGSEEILVKPLPAYLKSCGCYSGVTIMGDGKTAMILDPEGLLRVSGMEINEEDNKDVKSEQNTDDEGLSNTQNIFLFRGAGQEYFGVPLCQVQRILRITCNEIESIGHQEYLHYNENSLRLIRPSLNVATTRMDINSTTLFVLIPKDSSVPFGILFPEKIGITSAIISDPPSTLCFPGLNGAFQYQSKLVMVLDLTQVAWLEKEVSTNVEGVKLSI